jgi:hypothetical protein
LPKDNENILPLFGDELLVPSEPQGFCPEEMVRCEECLRANPPTIVTCLYCTASLPFSEKTAHLQKPGLRPLEKWEQGYNCILLPMSPDDLADGSLLEAGSLLKLSSDHLKRITATEMLLPLARTATVDESSLVRHRLKALGIQTLVVSDKDLGAEQSPAVRVRAAEIDETGMTTYQIAGAEGVSIPWTDLSLFVVGRLIVKRVEMQERKGGRAKGEILHLSEFFTDEAVVDIYCKERDGNYRFLANGFDFSCLGNRKGLLASENFLVLLELLRKYAPQAAYDDSYNSLRKALEPVWPSEQQTETRGLRRERPGKYSVGSVIETSNEGQFSRYSRLRRYLQRNPTRNLEAT